jgi:hypothetical protein
MCGCRANGKGLPSGVLLESLVLLIITVLETYSSPQALEDTYSSAKPNQY